MLTPQSMKCQMTPSTLLGVKSSPDFHSMQASLGDHSTKCRKWHISECPSKIIQIWYILKSIRSLGWEPNWLSQLCKWLSVTCMSAFWNFIECTGKALIQVLSLTASLSLTFSATHLLLWFSSSVLDSWVEYLQGLSYHSLYSII